MIHKEGQYNTA